MVRPTRFELRFDVIGDRVSFWAWRPAEEMPELPLVSFRIDTDLLEDSAVSVGVLTDQFNPTMEAIYRDVQVETVSIPEPSSAILCLTSLVGILRLRRRPVAFTGPAQAGASVTSSNHAQLKVAVQKICPVSGHREYTSCAKRRHPATSCGWEGGRRSHGVLQGQSNFWRHLLRTFYR